VRRCGSAFGQRKLGGIHGLSPLGFGRLDRTRRWRCGTTCATSFHVLFCPGFRLCVGASPAVRSRSMVGTLEALYDGSFRRVQRRRIEHMGRRLYVGNLSYNTTELELREVFGTIGTVAEAKVVTERETGRPRG